MAVFTPVTLEDLQPFMERYALGRAVGIRGISGGIENSNFFVQTESGEVVLTLFEKLSADEVPYYLGLMNHLGNKGVRIAAPIPDKNGELLHTLNGKPAALVVKLEGDWVENPGPGHCAQVASMMAKMHKAALGYPDRRPNPRALAWQAETAPQLLRFLDAHNGLLLQNEIRFQQEFQDSPVYWKLFRSPVHCDLFRNNVMFDGDTLSGFFDFYFAGEDTWLFDVAVAVNDWCIDLDTGAFDTARVRAFLDAYHAERPFSVDERTCWKTILRLAALRFWISRLYDFYLPREAELLKPHDPTHFERILKLRITEDPPELFA